MKDVNETDVSLKIVLSYNSLLNYPNYIIIDISRREKPIMDLVAINMKSEYFKDIAVTTFQIEELISEKLRALIERKKPRDYLDIYYILDEKEINWKKTFEIAKKKLKAVNEKLNIQKIIGDTDIVKELWKQDISELVADIPPFDKVLQKITDFLKKNANKI
ncbi:TPA: nucleotidyl transferase AbiEii/AbiGii toxin family protein [Candidatus Woesearchaeota archaeon]|nr:nucleotidyl transferase AbiEii/AbiGii toxin family protein [Candidatus Woesearchaeota archaeon]